jgi:hypothetical protein
MSHFFNEEIEKRTVDETLQIKIKYDNLALFYKIHMTELKTTELNFIKRYFNTIENFLENRLSDVCSACSSLRQLEEIKDDIETRIDKKKRREKQKSWF